MAGQTTYKRDGGRTIELFIPFDFMGKKVDAINLSPVRFDDTLNWQERKYKTVLALMASMSGLEESVLRELRYPDTDRVMAVFFDMLPPEIRDTIGQRQQEEVIQQPQPSLSNGGTELSASEASTLFPQPTSEEQDPAGLGVDLGE